MAHRLSGQSFQGESRHGLSHRAMIELDLLSPSFPALGLEKAIPAIWSMEIKNSDHRCVYDVTEWDAQCRCTVIGKLPNEGRS